MCQISINSKRFQFWTNLGLTGAKCLIKIIIDIKIEIGIFEIPIQPNLNKLSIFHFGTILGLAIGKYLIKINF